MPIVRLPREIAEPYVLTYLYRLSLCILVRLDMCIRTCLYSRKHVWRSKRHLHAAAPPLLMRRHGDIWCGFVQNEN